MAEVIFITPDEIAATTIMGGNVDPDKYVVNIVFAQMAVIEPLLGTELFNKITEDFTSDSLAGKYKELFEKYVQPITKNEALAEYIEVSPFMVDNGGTYKHTADNRETVTKDDVMFLSGKYHGLSQMFIQRFEKWICKNSKDIPEYKKYQDEVNATKVKTTSGWYFGKHNGGSL